MSAKTEPPIRPVAMPATPEPPFITGWVRVRQVPGAPQSFQLHHNGDLYGWWVTNGVKHGCRLSNSNMRAYGYEKCRCEPISSQRAENCPAHWEVVGSIG